MSLDQQDPIDLGQETPTDITFTYSVSWKPSDTLFEDRFNRLLEASFFEHKVKKKYIPPNDDSSC